MTIALFLQVATGGLLMGLIYALVAAGLSLIFGLMDVVNFAHGELMMVAMYAAFILWHATGLDPLLLIPVVALLLFGVGVAGAMLAGFYYVSPNVGANFALIAYVTVALGGFGSLLGALVAGLLIGETEAMTALFVDPALKQVGIFAIYIAVLMFRPRGLFGKL